jgi:ribosomal protein S18 acetylase RimI-like enzyme
MIMVRNVRASDIKDIFTLSREIFREEDEIPLVKLAIQQYVPALSLVAVEDNHIIGFTLVCNKMTKIYYNFLSKIPSCYELAFLGISPRKQGCGLGKRLLKETLLAIFQRSKQFTCWLLVDEINVNAIHLYQKLGFRSWIKTSPNITPLPGYIMGISYRRFIKLINNYR